MEVLFSFIKQPLRAACISLHNQSLHAAHLHHHSAGALLLKNELIRGQFDAAAAIASDFLLGLGFGFFRCSSSSLSFLFPSLLPLVLVPLLSALCITLVKSSCLPTAVLGAISLPGSCILIDGCCCIIPAVLEFKWLFSL